MTSHSVSISLSLLLLLSLLLPVFIHISPVLSSFPFPILMSRVRFKLPRQPRDICSPHLNQIDNKNCAACIRLSCPQQLTGVSPSQPAPATANTAAVAPTSTATPPFSCSTSTTFIDGRVMQALNEKRLTICCCCCCCCCSRDQKLVCQATCQHPANRHASGLRIHTLTHTQHTTYTHSTHTLTYRGQPKINCNPANDSVK